MLDLCKSPRFLSITFMHHDFSYSELANYNIGSDELSLGRRVDGTVNL